MEKKGWIINTLQKPDSFHFCCTVMNTHSGPLFLSDLRASVDEVVNEMRNSENVKLGGNAAVYGMAQSMPPGNVLYCTSRCVYTVVFACTSTSTAYICTLYFLSSL